MSNFPPHGPSAIFWDQLETCPDTAEWNRLTERWSLDDIADRLGFPNGNLSTRPMPVWMASWLLERIVSSVQNSRSYGAGGRLSMMLSNSMPSLLQYDWPEHTHIVSWIARLASARTEAGRIVACALVEMESLWAARVQDRHSAIGSLMLVAEKEDWSNFHDIRDIVSTLWRSLDATWPEPLVERLSQLGARITGIDALEPSNGALRDTLNLAVSSASRKMTHDNASTRITTQKARAAISEWLPAMHGLLLSQRITQPSVVGLLQLDPDGLRNHPGLRAEVIAHAGGNSPIHHYVGFGFFPLLEAVLENWPLDAALEYIRALERSQAWHSQKNRTDALGKIIPYLKEHVATEEEAQSLCHFSDPEIRLFGILTSGTLPAAGNATLSPKQDASRQTLA